MRNSFRPSVLVLSFAALLALFSAAERALAQTEISLDESVLGVLPITGSAREEHITKIAILPSLAPDFEDVIVRSVVRRDLELTGMFDVMPDSVAPQGFYGFDDPVDIAAWQKLGAEVIIKVAAKADGGSRLKIFGLCYFMNTGKEPVYQKTLVVDKADVRVTAHRITDALLGAITGRNGGFASQLAFSAKTGKNSTIFTVDADGHNLATASDLNMTAIAPTWGPKASLFYSVSQDYSPFFVWNQGLKQRFDLPFSTSIYSIAFNRDKTKVAVAVAENSKSSIYVGNANGSGLTKVSTTELATRPVFSPSGKLAWIGGGDSQGTQRVYVDGKAVSPSGFAAAAPTFCDTEDGVFLIFSVSVGGDRQDLILTNERGGNVTRLTQNQGSNTNPACSPDGRLLAYFSTQKNDTGLYVKSLKSWKTQKISSRLGESLRWEPLPAPVVPAHPAAVVPAKAAPAASPSAPANPAQPAAEPRAPSAGPKP